MATTRGSKGQTAKVFFGVAFTDATGLATDPTGTPTIKVYYVDPSGVLTLKATLNLAKQASTTGWWGAFLDISNVTTYPAGDYQVVATPTVSAIATVLTDSFEIDDMPVGASGGFVSGAYCSEAQVRGMAKALVDTVQVPQALVLNKCVEAAREIDLALRSRYVVPFAATYDDGIVLICMWLAAALTIENLQSMPGNVNEFAKTLHSWVDEKLADILSGTYILSVATRTDAPAGTLPAGFALARVFSRDSTISDMAEF